MTSAWRRLRKYARKKAMAARSRNPELARYQMLYWRYWHRVYGGHDWLWGRPEPAKRRQR